MSAHEDIEILRQRFALESYQLLAQARQLIASKAKSAFKDLLEKVLQLKQQAHDAGIFDVSTLSLQLEDELNQHMTNKFKTDAEAKKTFSSYLDGIEQFLNFYFKHTGNALHIDQLLKPEEREQLNQQVLELYRIEAREHIQDIHQILLALENKEGQQEAHIEAVYRGVHSIKGDSNAIGQDEIAALAHVLESRLSQWQESNRALTESDIENLFSAVSELEDKIMAQVGSIDSPEVIHPQKSVLAPEQLDISHLPLEIQDVFLAESRSLLQQMRQELGLLKALETLDVGALDLLFRAAHTLAGNAGALDLSPCAERLAAFEAQLAEVKKRLPLESDVCLPDLLNRFQEIRHYFNDADPAPALEIPEEIREIFVMEASDLARDMQSALDDLQANQGNWDAQSLKPLQRAVHTLKGNAHALGVSFIGEKCVELEALISTLEKTLPSIAETRWSRLKVAFSELFMTVKSIQTPEVPVQIAPVNDSEEETEIPEEIRDIFLTESQDLLATIHQELLHLEEDPDSTSTSIEIIYRAMHTLKGNANALGLEKIGALAHHIENHLSQLREQTDSNSQAHLATLFKDIEGLQQQIARLSQKQEEKKSERQTQERKSKRTTSQRTKQQLINTVDGTKKAFEAFSQVVSSPALEKSLEKRPEKENLPKADVIHDETIRVSIAKIDKLINLSDELLLTRIQQEQHIREIRHIQHQINALKFLFEGAKESQQNLLPDFHKIEKQQEVLLKQMRQGNAEFTLLIDDLQHHARATRMLPAAYLLNPLRLVVRNTAAKLGKKVSFHIKGEEIELDRLLIERLKDPLSHILRNAIDHGIEMPAQRLAVHKEATASISFVVTQVGNMIRLQVHDDGQGINYQRIRDKALQLNLVSSQQLQDLSDYDLHQLMFSAGFSTADKITDVSGRGVGLDVVKANLDALNGSIEIHSEAGKGTLFTLLVPLTLTSFDAFLIRLNAQTYAVPRSSVLSTISVSNKLIDAETLSPVIYYDGQPLRAVELREVLELPERQGALPSEPAALIVESNQQRYALLIDGIIESQQMVMKGLGLQLQKVPFVSGATILGNGEPVVVLNLTEIIHEISGARTLIAHSRSQILQPGQAENRVTRVLVVDDSVTTRTLEKNILEAAGFEVIIAKNGKEGKDAVLAHMPNIDLIITDVEMPVMTGYEFASWVKHESQYAATPVLMVTSLATPEFKAQGFASGIDAYIVKGEFNQQYFLETIAKLLKKSVISSI